MTTTDVPALAWLLAAPSALLLAAAVWRIVVLTRRATLGRGSGAADVARFAALLLGAAALNTLLRIALRAFVEGWPPAYGADRDARAFIDVLVGLGLLAVLAHLLEYARRNRAHRIRELRLQAELARAELHRATAELRVLKLQLDPHFLFNALNAVDVLVRSAPVRAERMVVSLAELLRRSMTSVARQEVPLREEIESLEPFLEVEQLRLDQKLHVEWEIDPELRDALVPHMVLQPLVENAVKHGIAPAGGAGRLRIAARRAGARLELEVSDDGVGVRAAEGGRAGHGIGTANTRARLEQLYGDDGGLELLSPAGGGTTARVRIPYHLEPVLDRSSPRPTERQIALRTRPPAAGSAAAAAVAFAALVWIVSDNYLARVGTPTTDGRIVTAAGAFASMALTCAALVHAAYRAYRVTVTRDLAERGWRAAVRPHAGPAALSAGILLACDIVSAAILNGWNRARPWPAAGIFLYSLAIYTVLYGGIAVLANAFEYARRSRERQMVEARLEGELARAELDRASAELRVLRMQLNPHVLFDTLHAISALLHRAPDTAARMVACLADLLRRAMTRVACDEVALEEEIDALKPLLRIEQLRSGGTLRVDWEIDDDALDAFVPQALLQPLVEHAIKQITADAGDACLSIAARRAGEWLELEVSAGGGGAGEGEMVAGRDDVAMMHADTRLRETYGGEYRIERIAGEGGGTTLRLRIPWHETPLAAGVSAGSGVSLKAAEAAS
ncbi:MAG TPA: histidine kinase [Longimicrobium sp.]|nr:histidine kinase [Longimicrobium sp.]